MVRMPSCLGLSLVCACFGVASAFAQPVKLRFSSIEPAQAPLTAQVFSTWAKDVSDASNGALAIEMFAGGTLGRNPAQQLKLILDGVADIAFAGPALTPGRFGGYEIVEFPFLVQNVREASLALWRVFDRGLLTGFDDLKVLLIGTNAPGFIHSRSPIRSLADLKGSRMRAGGVWRAKAVEALGAVPVALPATVVAESLSKGVIDAALAEWLFVQTFKIDEVVANHYEMPLGTSVLMVIMQKTKYEALPSAARAAVDKLSGEPYVRRMIEVFEATEASTRARVAKSQRASVITPSAAEMAEWRKLTDPVLDLWRRESAANERVFQGYTAALKSIR